MSESSTPAIVVVEDEPDLLVILNRLIRDVRNGHDIVTVASGQQALAQFNLRPVPLLIADHSMPGMTGLELIRTVKQISSRTTCVLITAYASPNLERDALAAGADHFLLKPFSLPRFEQIVREAVG